MLSEFVGSYMYVTAAFFAAAPLCDGFDVAPFLMATTDVRVIGESMPGSTGGSPPGGGGCGGGGGGRGRGGGYGGGYSGGDGGGNGGDKGGSPPDEDPEDDLSAFARRKCRRCGKVEYLRKGGCANPSCVALLVFSEIIFPEEV